MTTLPITDEGKRLAYYDLLHWLWSCQLQRQRLAESTEMEQKALGESA